MMTDSLPIAKIVRVANAHLNEVGRYGDYARVIKYLTDQGFAQNTTSIDLFYEAYRHPHYYNDTSIATLIFFDHTERLVKVEFTVIP